MLSLRMGLYGMALLLSALREGTLPVLHGPSTKCKPSPTDSADKALNPVTDPGKEQP